jgi:hypothetical protein
VEFDLQNLSIIEQHDLFTKSFTRDKRPATNWSASLASTSGREFAQSGNYSQGIRLIGTAQRIRRIAKISISNQQKVLPLAKLALKAHALGDLKARDHTALDLLAGLPRQFRRFAGISFAPDRGGRQNGSSMRESRSWTTGAARCYPRSAP